MSTLKVNAITNVAGTGNATPTPIGVGQTVQNVTSSRALGTTYTNSTGRPIFVNVAMSSSIAANPLLTVNGVVYYGTGNTAGITLSVSAIVPTGATYVASVSGGTPGLVYWSELR